MIKNIKLYYELLKYGYKLKVNICGILFCTICGIIFLIFSPSRDGLSLYMLMVSSVFIMQLVSSMEMSGLIKSSPKFRSFYYGIPRVVNITCAIFYYTVLVVTRLVMSASFEEFSQGIGNELLICGIIYIIMVFYAMLAFKLFFISTIIFLIFYCGLFTFGALLNEFTRLTLCEGIIASVICVITGMLLSEIIKKCTYKKQISKYAFGVNLRKYM